MSDLTQLPNVGPVLASNLEEIGITTAQDLQQSDAKEVFLKIRASVDPEACLHQLQGIKGAIEGIPKTQLSRECKDDLRDFFNAL